MKHILFVLCMFIATGCSATPSASDREASRGGPERVDARSCSMSFAELFQLARGRAWTDEEVLGFQALDQDGKNRVVKQLAAEAGGIKTEDQVGSDGLVYTAFWRE